MANCQHYLEKAKDTTRELLQQVETRDHVVEKRIAKVDSVHKLLLENQLVIMQALSEKK